MKTSRQRLLNFIENKRVVTVREISLALKMTSANARHHLSILIEQGSVEVIGKHIGKGRGRPQFLYKARRTKRDNIKDLAIILFDLWLENKNPEEKEILLKIIAQSITKGKIAPTNRQTKRLNDTIQQLNQMNYEARWEAHHEAPHVILENCPYLDIVREIPELCNVNRYILEELLGTSVSQVTKLESSKSGLHRCVFIIDTV